MTIFPVIGKSARRWVALLGGRPAAPGVAQWPAFPGARMEMGITYLPKPYDTAALAAMVRLCITDGLTR